MCASCPVHKVQPYFSLTQVQYSDSTAAIKHTVITVALVGRGRGRGGEEEEGGEQRGRRGGWGGGRGKGKEEEGRRKVECDGR